MTFGRGLLAGLFVAAGVLHFLFTTTYVKIVPPYLPDPVLLVQISGVAEILGGVGLLLPSTRRLAAWGLIALLVAVLPANVTMALDRVRWAAIPAWVLWARVPLQLPMIWWAWLYTRP
jgi:uncharacterized membrane protein